MSEPLLVIGEVWPGPGLPRAGAIACAGGRIVAVGDEVACAAALPAGHRRLALAGATVLPGFVDAHVHILAAATAAAGVDCSPATAPDIPALLDCIAEAAATTPPGQWIRATGYEETMLAEERHPRRDELDRVAPQHPVRLIHRTGHAEVLNSLALQRAGIDEGTPEPPGAGFGRSLEDGRLDGLLLGMAERIEAAMPPPDPEQTAAHVEAWCAARLAEGVTALVDAGPRNGLEQWRFLEGLLASGRVRQAVAMMEPVAAPGTLPETGAGARLRRGPSKAMPRVLEHELGVDAVALAAGWTAALEAGQTVAVHANTPAAVALALDAFALAGAPAGQRIEHAPVLPEPLLARVVAAGHAVVAQPGLLLEVPRRYERLLDAERLAALHPWRRFVDAGGVLAASSDAPVSRGTPLASVAALSTARAAAPGNGTGLGVEEAVWAWTATAAAVSGLGERGTLHAGAPADLVVIDGPLEVDPLACRVVATVVDGEVAFRSGSRHASP